MRERPRLAVVVSHPIQYFAPFYRALAASDEVHLRVFFASRIGLDRTLDPGMGVEIAWASDLLGGYAHEFLPRADGIRKVGFREIDNPGIGTALERFTPDVVLLHGYAQLTMLKALVWCRRRSVPAMMISDSSRHCGSGPVKQALKAAVLPDLLRQFQAFLTIGDANEGYLAAFGIAHERIFRVPMCVDETFWAHRRKRREIRRAARASLGLADDDLAVLFAGKLLARKRPRDVLQALRLVAAVPQPRRIQVLFAGDGALRAALETEAAQDRLAARFLGFLNIDALPAHYCAADVLAHPAGNEPFGMTVLEAAVLGLPLVLSNRVGAIGPTSIARPGENALVYPCGDTGALAGHLVRLAREPETCRRLSGASLRISRRHDGAASVAATLAAVSYCTDQRHLAMPGRDQLTTARSVTRRQFVPSENASTAPPLSSDT